MKAILNDFTQGLRDFGQQCPDVMQGFMGMLHPAFQDGAVAVKQKELIAVSLGVYTGNEHCISYHVHKAIECGASQQEILEAASVAVTFGGGPAIAHVLTSVQDALDAFAGATTNR